MVVRGTEGGSVREGKGREGKWFHKNISEPYVGGSGESLTQPNSPDLSPTIR